MMNNNVTRIILFILSSLVNGIHNLDYTDLEALGVSCPNRDKCQGYMNNLSYTERSCECDFACNTYNDCCIDALRRRSSNINGMKCIHYGINNNTGVYAISNCSSSWSGPIQLRQKCEGPDDFRDPLNAAPVVSVPQGVTYRNRYCAECNNANTQNLKSFQLKLACGNLNFLSEAQILADLVYSQALHSWGINRLNSFGNATNFIACDIIFDVPDYLNRSIRFCRSDLISSCPPSWTRQVIRRACDEYMAVVYDHDKTAYRNPHCAICNQRPVTQVSCVNSLLGRKRPMSFALLLDVNQSDGEHVGMQRVVTPECPANHKYDPFFKKCRRLVCALPGYVVVDGRCVRS